MDFFRRRKKPDPKAITEAPTPRASSTTMTEPALFGCVVRNELDHVISSHLRGEDFHVVDALGNTVLHRAAALNNRYMVKCILSMTSGNPLYEKKNLKGETAVDVATNPAIKSDIGIFLQKSNKAPNHHFAYNKRLVESRIRSASSCHKVLLSLDGGGMRAVSEITLLCYLERILEGPLVKYVSWFAGSSAGSLIGSFLAVGKTANETRRLMIEKRYETFQPNDKKYPKYGVRKHEANIQAVIGENTKMSALKARLVITATKVKSSPPTLVLFRSFAPRIPSWEYDKFGYVNPESILVWKAVRSSTAAPVYFESFHGLTDGAISSNNPVLILMSEFFKLRKIERHCDIKNDDDIGAVISIGTGVEPAKPMPGGIDLFVNGAFSLGLDFFEICGRGKNLVTMFVDGCTSPYTSVSPAREWCHSTGIPFFRFSAPLSRVMDLDACEPKDMVDLMYDTEVYIHRNREELQLVASLLKSIPQTATASTSRTARDMSPIRSTTALDLKTAKAHTMPNYGSPTASTGDE